MKHIKLSSTAKKLIIGFIILDVISFVAWILSIMYDYQYLMYGPNSLSVELFGLTTFFLLIPLNIIMYYKDHKHWKNHLELVIVGFVVFITMLLVYYYLWEKLLTAESMIPLASALICAVLVMLWFMYILAYPIYHMYQKN